MKYLNNFKRLRDIFSILLLVIPRFIKSSYTRVNAASSNSVLPVAKGSNKN
ncbi:MAG: hypothetical protein LBT85_00360 [Bifidobacteriaceae bacterium]|nr:hypothetical protein [Bifidobacteriaceae bacterium]